MMLGEKEGGKRAVPRDFLEREGPIPDAISVEKTTPPNRVPKREGGKTAHLWELRGGGVTSGLIRGEGVRWDISFSVKNDGENKSEGWFSSAEGEKSMGANGRSLNEG